MPNPTDSVFVNLLHPGDFKSDVAISIAIQDLVSGRQDAAATAWEIDEMIIVEHQEEPQKPSGGQR
ncbi:hypothetical protein J3458_005034 [Metarhizium acridum]|nr:hypothetical protein J3458_005034 [Metarhizium acridum]